MNRDSLYHWAVVSGPKKDYIFVLTRTREITKDVRSTILRCSAEQGLPIDKLIYRQGDPQS